ncbi:hypothetical protein QQP08_015353 [Theobroma cacao]|nr:hypothetical protein QQP08_015353 [Theobroma cacao]
MWNALGDAFGQESQEREFYLLQTLQTNRKDNLSIPNYIRKFKAIFDDLAVIRKPIMIKPKGLGHRYDSFVTTMMKTPIPSFREIVPLLQGHETMKSVNFPNSFASVLNINLIEGSSTTDLDNHRLISPIKDGILGAKPFTFAANVSAKQDQDTQAYC